MKLDAEDIRDLAPVIREVVETVLQDLNGKRSTPTLALKPRDAAAAIGISERLLWERTKAGEVPHKRIASRIVYPVEALRQYIEQLTTANP